MLKLHSKTFPIEPCGKIILRIVEAKKKRTHICSGEIDHFHVKNWFSKSHIDTGTPQVILAMSQPYPWRIHHILANYRAYIKYVRVTLIYLLALCTLSISISLYSVGRVEFFCANSILDILSS